ncbi:MAG: hypothetical protein K6D37_08360 [Prevotella sp.]|nr:hypothetical protein [Prevotella sp.]
MLFIFGVVGLSFASMQELQIVPLEIIDLQPAGNGNTKNPPIPLMATLDDYVLTLPTTSVDYLLELRNETGNVVYTTFLPSGTTQAFLPTSLYGTYELRLMATTYYYKGEVSL